MEVRRVMVFIAVTWWCSVSVYSQHAIRKYYVEDYVTDWKEGTATVNSWGTDSAVFLILSRWNTYSPGDRANFTITIPDSDGIVVTYDTVDLRRNSNTNQCIDYIQLNTEPRMCNVDAVPASDVLLTKEVSVYFHADDTRSIEVKRGFRILFTAFREGFNGTCNRTETVTGNSIEYFHCEEYDVCIWNGFVCDGYNNCGDNSDERDSSLCILSSKQSPTAMMVVLAITSAVVIGVFGVLIYRLAKKSS